MSLSGNLLAMPGMGSDSLYPSVQTATLFPGQADHPEWKSDCVHASVPVVVNFLCQDDWATGYSAIWLNIFLSISVRVFLDEMYL